MKINKLLTPYNHNPGTTDRIKYIVIHYVGALEEQKQIASITPADPAEPAHIIFWILTGVSGRVLRIGISLGTAGQRPTGIRNAEMKTASE